MKKYIVQYRINGGDLLPFGTLRAKCAANAIRYAADCLRDSEGDLEIIATTEA